MYKSVCVVICFLCLSVFSVSAQEGDSYLKTYQERIEKNPKDVDFAIRFKNDQTKFRQGEIIPVDLSFKTSTPNRYDFLNRTYDRSGRLDLDGFIIDKKEQTFDPLYDYFYRGGMMSSGGLYTNPTLGSGAEVVSYELNEFLSFKEPGKYRIYIASPRVSPKKDGKDRFSSAFGGSGVPLVSNIIEFEILPADEKWQKEKFAEAVSRDCRILRYLGTKAAAKEMLIRFSRGDKTCESGNYIGLYGSPERRFIVDEMEKMLVSSDYAVENGFFQMLVRLDYFLNNPLPEKTEPNSWELRNKKETEIQNLIKLGYLEKFAKALPNKDEKVFQKSLETYFSYHADGEKPPPAELLNVLVKSFGSLPKQTQWIILQNSLDKIKTPAMLPVLQSIYDNLKETNLEAHDVFYDRDLFNQSIKGIYDLDRNIGKQIILNEMRRPKQRVYTSVLELLPKTDAPETENILLEKLSGENIQADNLRSVFMLTDHYETPKLIARLRENYADKIEKSECGAQIEFLKIFLKSDIKFGEEMLSKTVKTEAGENCIGANLAEVIKPHWSAEIEQNVLKILENENDFLVSNATELLGKYGSIEAKDKIWKRFERFNKEESGKEDFAEKKDDYSANWQTSLAESSFAVALSQSPNWFFEQESNARLSKLCLYDFCKQYVEELNKILTAPVKIETAFDEENQLTFSVSQYKNLTLDALKKKLEQFPPDTSFTWIPNAKNPDDAKNFQEIKEFVEANRMKLKIKD